MKTSFKDSKHKETLSMRSLHRRLMGFDRVYVPLGALLCGSL